MVFYATIEHGSLYIEEEYNDMGMLESILRESGMKDYIAHLYTEIVLMGMEESYSSDEFNKKWNLYIQKILVALKEQGHEIKYVK